MHRERLSCPAGKTGTLELRDGPPSWEPFTPGIHVQAAERSSPELPATSLTIRLLSHLLDCLAPLNAIFQQLNVFVLEQFGHQSMFVKKIFPGTVSGEVSGA